MSNVVCTKCGSEAYSKCPFCRNVFPTDQLITVLQSVIDIRLGRFDRKEGEPTDLLIAYTLGNRSLDEAFEDLVAHLSSLTEEQRKKLLCHHTWQFKPGFSSSIGCGHGVKKDVCNTA